MEAGGESTAGGGCSEEGERPIDEAGQDRCFIFRLDGVTAAFEKRGGESCCLVWTLANARPTPAAVVLRLR